MTVTILLIRHAAHAELGRVLSGRAPGGRLSSSGLLQAERLARWSSAEGVAAIHTSPVLRARETAQAIGASLGMAPRVSDALDEIDFGDWTGKHFDQLASDPDWQRWNNNRAQARAPRGETMTEVQQRMTDFMRAIAETAAGATVAFVSHCDTIRAAIAGILGLSLDYVLRFEIAPASVSRVQLGDWGGRVLSLNEYTA
ncbi:MAG: histidine phosphatase family protein [Erythrobacter sp.]|nr:MAG: histidine phosphatase family protein [Erythrobacter sp.]